MHRCVTPFYVMNEQLTTHNLAVFVVIQYAAYTWYCLSYIPYGRDLVKRVIPM